MATRLASAAAGVLPLATGSALRGAVLGSFANAVVIGVPTADDPRVVSLLTGRAAGVPTGVRIASATALPQPPPGTTAVVGDGRVVLDGLDVRVVRWWDSQVPVLHPVPARVAALSLSAGRAERGVPDGAVAALRTSLAVGGCRAAAHLDGDFDAAIDGLVGLGRGLTPAGDDVIAGLLSALHALGRKHVIGRVRSRLQNLADSTTTLSADLLRLAAEGHACLEALAALRSMGGARSAPAMDPAAGAVGRLLSIGHTSGADLATGMAVGLEFAMTSRACAADVQSVIADRQVME